MDEHVKSRTSPWTEGKIGRVLARNTFASDLCVLPNCTWTGDEIDLLVVTMARRIIDVEIKISRADLKADKNKGKWWHQDWSGPPGSGRPPKIPRPWPTKVWKHYYAMPEEIWTEALLEHIQPVSGVLLVYGKKFGSEHVRCVKRAKPCKDVAVLTDQQVVRIARLASLRMWDAYKAAERRVLDEAQMQQHSATEVRPNDR
jgi:hypothetical protein